MSHPPAKVQLVPEKLVEKVWGREEWLVNVEKYCAKKLIMEPDTGSSRHYHTKKDETFIILEGCCKLEVGEDELNVKSHSLIAGTSYRLHPGVVHRFLNPYPTTCIILEVSTHHEDSDVTRLSESFGPSKSNGGKT